MTGRAAPHFGYAATDSVIPCVQITAQQVLPMKPGILGHQAVHRTHTVVVKRVYGVTLAHALSRALTWMHEHGDPR